MSSLVFALDAVMPIMLTVAIGYLLKRIGLMKEDFAKQANKLVFRVFLPVMLFLNIYKIENLANIDFTYVIYAVATVLAITAIAIPLIILFTDNKSRRGVILQAAFRSNYALIGIPLATSLYGEEGAVVATVLSAVIIPTFNILAVITLSIFSDKNEKIDAKKILLGIVKNPLIQGVVLGLCALGIRAILVELGVSFRLTDVTAVYTVLGYLSSLATPLALLVLGAQFEFSAVLELKREIIFGTVLRTVAVPLIGLGVAYLFFRDIFTGAHFATFVAVFSTPIAVSSVPMAQEMDGDVTLAGQLVIFTTLASAVTIFLASFLLRTAGIF